MHLQYTVSFILLSTLLIIFSNANRNLHIHNRFTVGPWPTLSCLQPGCYRSFKNRSSHKSHISAAHPHLGDPSTYLLPETTMSFTEPSYHSFDFQASPNLYQSSSPFAISESSERASVVVSEPSNAGSKPMDKPGYDPMDINPLSALINENVLPCSDGREALSASINNPPSPVALADDSSSLSNNGNDPHDLGSDCTSATCGLTCPPTMCTYHHQLNGMLYLTSSHPNSNQSH